MPNWGLTLGHYSDSEKPCETDVNVAINAKWKILIGRFLGKKVYQGKLDVQLLWAIWYVIYDICRQNLESSN